MVGDPDGAPWWRIGSRYPLLIVKGDNKGDQEVLCVQFPVGAGSTKVIPKTLKKVW